MLKLDPLSTLINEIFPYRELQEAEDKLATTEKKVKLVQISDRIRSFKEYSEFSGLELKRKETEFAHFMENEYQSAIKGITETYTPKILSIENSLSETQKQIGIIDKALQEFVEKEILRKENLTIARQELADYKKILEEHKGIYPPGTKIPQDKLKQFLECNENITQFIDAMYQTEKVANSWYGFNRSNLYNKYLHYTSIFGASDFDEDINTLIGYISDKIGLIDTELQIDISSEVVLQVKSRPEFLGEENLWIMKEKFQKTQPEKNKLEDSILNQQQAFQKIKDEKDEHLKLWEDKKSVLEKDINNTRLEHLIKVLEHNIATVASDSYKYECKIADIEKAQEELEKLIREFESRSDNEALELLTHSEKQFTTNQFETIWDEATGTQLQIRIRDSLITLQKEIDNISSLEKTIKDIPVNLATQKEKLELELKSFEEKKRLLDQTLEQLRKVNQEKIQLIHEKKGSLIALKKLNDIKQTIHAHFSALIESNYIPENKDSRDHWINAIDQFKEDFLVSLDELSKSTNSAVKQKYEEVAFMVHQINSRYRELNELIFDSTDLPKTEPVIKNPIEKISSKYFGDGTSQGVFCNYLQERAEQFWFKDLIRNIAAFAFGYFGYKTDGQLRHDYIELELKPAFALYKSGGEYDDLVKVIDEGKDKFSPRAKEGGVAYDKSLLKMLRDFKADVDLFSKRPELPKGEESRLEWWYIY